KKIRVVATDVDGVFTAGEIIILDGGAGDLKIWNVRDRLAMALLKNAGSPVALAFVTGRSSEDVRRRAAEFGASLYEQCADKKKAFDVIISKAGIRPDEAASIGDDVIDLPMLSAAGIAVCPADADPEVKKICDIVLRARGGKGAFREFAEMLLKSRGLWSRAIAPYKP
ncbi:MAG: HAD hydrolase family protein, partial [Endomicrobiia bacterium]|nr:HAD hydrolase family protein [Endomicrobiia bacterium]